MKDAYTAYTLVVTLYTVNLVGVKSRKKISIALPSERRIVHRGI